MDSHSARQYVQTLFPQVRVQEASEKNSASENASETSEDEQATENVADDNEEWTSRTHVQTHPEVPSECQEVQLEAIKVVSFDVEVQTSEFTA